MIILLKNVELYYEFYDNNKNDTLIMLHGNGENSSIFHSALKELNKYFNVYLIDSRGHGKSSSYNYDFHYSDMMEDIHEFISKLNIKNPYIYGFSDGAIIALLLQIKYNIAKELILSGVNIKYDGLDDITYNEILKNAKQNDNSLITRLNKLMAYEPNINLASLNKITCKVYLLFGENDVILKSHQKLIKQNIKRSSLMIIKNEDHGSYIYNNIKIGKIIVKLLKNQNL